MTSTAVQPLLRLDGVELTYPNGTRALNGATLEFYQGEFTVVLGLSGAGKTSLLRCMNLLQKPTGGAIISSVVGLLERKARIRAHRRRTAMIFQHHQLLPRFSALHNVLTGRLGHHGTLRSLLPLPQADIALAFDCLERVGLADKALTRVDNLSGGQMQRVGVARALAQQPDTLLADEPVASLDPATADKVLSLLRRVCQEDAITAVVSLHQVELATRFADRIIGLAQGEVVFDGPPSALTTQVLGIIYDRRAADAASAQQHPEPDQSGLAASSSRPPLQEHQS